MIAATTIRKKILMNLFPLNNACFDPNYVPPMLQMAIGTESRYMMFPVEANSAMALRLVARFNIFALALAVIKSKPINKMKLIMKNEPVPGPIIPS